MPAHSSVMGKDLDPNNMALPSARATHEPSPDGLGHSVGVPNAWPAIEYDGCYPVDEDFADFTTDKLPLSFTEAQAWLPRELPNACVYMCCQCDVRRAKDRLGKPIWRINFSTMGWSGAESIIGLINSRPDLRLQMYSWRRGGHYVFEVPFVKSERPISEIRKQAWETRRAKYGERGHR